MNDEDEVVPVGQDLTGPRGLEVAIVLGIEASLGYPARQAEYRLSRFSQANDLDVPDSSPHPELRFHVVVGLDEGDSPVSFRDAEAAEIDELVARDRRAAALVLPTAHRNHDVHSARVTSGGYTRKCLLEVMRAAAEHSYPQTVLPPERLGRRSPTARERDRLAMPAEDIHECTAPS